MLERFQAHSTISAYIPSFKTFWCAPKTSHRCPLPSKASGRMCLHDGRTPQPCMWLLRGVEMGCTPRRLMEGVKDRLEDAQQLMPRGQATSLQVHPTSAPVPNCLRVVLWQTWQSTGDPYILFIARSMIQLCSSAAETFGMPVTVLTLPEELPALAMTSVLRSISPAQTARHCTSRGHMVPEPAPISESVPA